MRYSYFTKTSLVISSCFLSLTIVSATPLPSKGSLLQESPSQNEPIVEMDASEQSYDKAVVEKASETEHLEKPIFFLKSASGDNPLQNEHTIFEFPFSRSSVWANINDTDLDSCEADDRDELETYFNHIEFSLDEASASLNQDTLNVRVESLKSSKESPDIKQNNSNSPIASKPDLEEGTSPDTALQQSDLIPEHSLSPTTQVPNIPLYTNRRIKGFIRIYTHSKRYVLVKAIERSAKYLGMINRIFREYELPPNLAYLAVVESNFNPNARSRANAVGLWQFMSYTGRSFGLNRSWWHDERYDPEKSTIAAAKYLKHLHKVFKGNWELALAAYNSGSGTVRRAIHKAKASGKPFDYWSLKLPRETRGYVPAFYAVATIFDDLKKHGFPPAPKLRDLPSKKSLSVAGGVPLQQIGEVLDIDYRTLKEFNPSIRLGGLTPAIHDTYAIAIPADTEVSPKQVSALEALKKQRYKSWKYHTVRSGETLWSISRSYRIPIKKIVRFNQFRRKNLIRIGQKLILPVPIDYSPPVVASKTKIIKKALDRLPGITWVHKVKKGETLWRISQIYKVPLSKLKHWNRIALRKRVLSIGTEIVLKLPDSELDSRI